MDALEIWRAATAAGVALEPRPGGRLGIIGPRAAVAALEGDIAANKAGLLALLREDGRHGCARCGGEVYRASADGQSWCRRHDHRRHLLDLARLAGYPRLDLFPPMQFVVPAGAGGWGEFARHVAGGTLSAALRHLRSRHGANPGGVRPPDSTHRPWAD